MTLDRFNINNGKLESCEYNFDGFKSFTSSVIKDKMLNVHICKVLLLVKLHIREVHFSSWFKQRKDSPLKKRFQNFAMPYFPEVSMLQLLISRGTNINFQSNSIKITCCDKSAITKVKEFYHVRESISSINQKFS